MAVERLQDYSPGRPITGPFDVQQELQRVSLAVRNRVRFRGIFTPDTEPQMTPPPALLDEWLIYDPVAATYRMRRKVSERDPQFASWDVDLENA